MRGAALSFAEKVRQGSSEHSITTSLITAETQASRLRLALNEMGIQWATSMPREPAFGREQATRFMHVRGFSRTCYVERFPGTEIDAGCLFRLFPPDPPIPPPSHAPPLPPNS